MGDLRVSKLSRKKDYIVYIAELLNDIEALERMLQENLFEKAPIRIGAEQEFCLVDSQWEPANNSMEVLEAINDPHFTTEIARYNLEANLDPVELKGDCFSQVHSQLKTLLEKANFHAQKLHSKILLSGILPTIKTRHLDIDYMAPVDRYFVINEAIKESRKHEFEIHIKGVDELNILHDSVLFEGCNTSFQSHLQIDPDDFVTSYNWAQAISGPILSICTNSPLLFGKELWNETRIALFTQSVDTRANSFVLNENESRVSFGRHWATGSVSDIFKDNIVRFRSLVTSDFEEDSMEELDRGNIPKLKALNLHNGTVYKWNRPCYGVGGGKPHLRIENRYIPSGPSTTDEIANMMFWVGVMRGRPAKYDKVHEIMDFKDAKANFYIAARYGMAAQFYWDNKLISSSELILNTLLPMAYKGLYKMKVDPKDVEFYLTVIENRVKTQSGSRWMVNSYRNLLKKTKKPEALKIITSKIYKNQEKGYTIDAWKVLKQAKEEIKPENKRVEHYMNIDVFTAHRKDSCALVCAMMKWKNIHHVPVLDTDKNLIGLITWTDMKDTVNHKESLNQNVEKIMTKQLITATRAESLQSAREKMKKNQINCLPVVRGSKLVGIITNKDL